MLVALDGGFGACPATLLAPNLILTARHCVSNTVNQPFACDIKGNLVNFPGTQVGADHPVNRLLVFIGKDRPDPLTAKIAGVGKKIFHDDSKVLCSHDLALVLLDRDIALPIAPIRLDEPVVANETFTAVGWGYTETGTPSVRQQRADIKVIAVGPNASGGEPTPPNDFKVGESICSGDSGGPALASSSSAVIGVVSRGGNGKMDPMDPSVGCTGTTARNFYTSTPPFKDLILQAFTEAGKEPWLENGPDPRLAKLGETCGTGAECRSGICTSYKQMNLCSQDCSADGICPMGWDCKMQDGQSLCLPHEDPPPPMMPPATGGCSQSGGTAHASWGLLLAAFLFARRRR